MALAIPVAAAGVTLYPTAVEIVKNVGPIFIGAVLGGARGAILTRAAEKKLKAAQAALDAIITTRDDNHPVLRPLVERMLACLSIDDNDVRKVVLNHATCDINVLITAILAAITRITPTVAIQRFSGVKAIGDTTNHKTQVLATIIAYTLVILQHREDMLGTDAFINHPKFKILSGDRVRCIDAVYKAIETPAALPKPTCLAGCNTKMTTVHRWAKSLALHASLDESITMFESVRGL